MIDFKAICDNLAARFAPATIATPSGAPAMRPPSGQMPKGIAVVPFAFVEATDGQVIAQDGGVWQHEMHVDVVFCLDKRQGDPRRVDANRQRWLPSLLAATEGQLKLGLGAQSGYSVMKAIPTGWRWAEETVSGIEFDAIRVHYTIYVNETVNGTGILVP